ncbi:MAG: 50S ribosomal protein L1 [Pseudomonadota bacterium]
MALSKRAKAMREKIDPTQAYELDAAIGLLKEFASKSFNESVDVSVNLGVDPRKSDQVVRGATVLPNGTGKSVRVAVFASGDAADAAREAGADVVGMEDLAETINGGSIEFEVAIAAPDAMRIVGQLGKVLGPRGLMPNPRTGTVTPNVAEAVRNAKAGQVQYRTDKAGIIHCSIGKVSFEEDKLRENLGALLGDLNKAKPPSAKGVYLQKVTVSSTMGPVITVEKSSLPD